MNPLSTGFQVTAKRKELESQNDPTCGSVVAANSPASTHVTPCSDSGWSPAVSLWILLAERPDTTSETLKSPNRSSTQWSHRTGQRNTAGPTTATTSGLAVLIQRYKNNHPAGGYLFCSLSSFWQFFFLLLAERSR